MRKVCLFLVALVLLAACQTGQEVTGPQAILDWQPTPFDERPPPPEATLPPLPVNERPELPPVPEVVAADAGPVPTLAPAPMPENVYVSEASGFTVPYPSSWELLDSDDSGPDLYDPALDLSLYAFSGFQNEEESYEALIEMFLEDEDGFFGDIAVEVEEEIPFAGDGMARMAFLVDQAEDSDFTIWLAQGEEGNQSYTFLVYGSFEDVQARQTTLRTIVSQAVPGGTHLYGLDRSETLVLLGGEPIPRDLDPARQTGSAANQIGLIYSGLVRLTPEMQVEPDLAESWTVSEDGTVYTFTLREGLEFHDGRPITTADFEYSWERATDPETDSTTAATYLGDILGVADKFDGTAETIAGLEVVDDRTLMVTLDGPKPYFLLKLTYPTSYVVDQYSVDAEDEDWVFEPNASGPYTLNEVREEAAIIYESNHNYHAPPALSQVVFLLYRVGSPSSLFESDEVDIIGIYGTEAKQIREPEDELNDRLLSTTTMCTSYIQVNNSMAPMDDPDVRRAFALAVDKEGLNELINEDLALVAESILPPAMPGFSAEQVQAAAERGYDPEAAREALAASSYADNLPPIIFTAGGYGTAERIDIDALVANWQEVLAADITVEFLDPQDYTRASRENHGHLANYGWCADYPDPENFLDVLFHSGSEFNVAGYSNLKIDALLEEARIELDPARRLALYQEIEAALLADVAAIPLDHGVDYTLVNPRVQGYVQAPMGAPIIHRLSLEPVEEGE